MAGVLILGGGFAAVVAAESLAKKLGPDHQITVVSRSRKFVFYPALVRLAFGQCEPSDISLDLREAMLDRRVRFIKGEIARINPHNRCVTITGGEFRGELPYDFVVLALGRRLATERITGFFEHADHLLSIDDALRFGEAIKAFHPGRSVIGHCPGARLPVPLFETAIALSRLHEKGESNRRAISIVSNETIDKMFGAEVSVKLDEVLRWHGIEFISDFEVSRVTPEAVVARDGRRLDCGLRMLIPPFCGPGAALGTGITDEEGYLRVDNTMRVRGAERMYAAGDCVSFAGPKMGHMAVRQAEVAAENLVAEIGGREAVSNYDHELMLVIDAGGSESIFAKKDLWSDDPVDIQQGRFWGWAKRRQEQYWKAQHG